MRIVFFLLLILLSVNGWGACQPWSYYANGASESRCRSGDYIPAGVTCEWVSCNKSTGNRCYHYPEGFTGEIDCRDYLQAGGSWINCKICDDEPDPCQNEKAECESMGGTFTGTTASDNGQTCCRSSCNVCGSDAMKKIYQTKVNNCCKSGQAPPDENQTCQTVSLPTSGCGMIVSSYGDFTSGGWQCQDPSSSFAASSRFREQCFDKSSSSSTAGSSSGGNSSGGNSSSNGDCPECPILEEILYTLGDQKGTVEDIYACLTNPYLCNLGDTLPPWVREKMEGILAQDSITANNTASIDSAVRAIGNFIKESDSATREVLRDVADSIVAALAADGDSALIRSLEGGFSTLDSTTDALNDSTRKWLRFIADSLGVGTDSIVAHIDSIVSRLPDSILDSILKYQKYASDNFDSAFWGAGNGFQKIDNLTDSAIKYFKRGFHYDSVYSAVYRDSLGVIHEAIDGISTSIGYDMGYGDTASKNLRDDLENITGVLQGMSDSLSKGSYDTNSTYNGYLTGYDTAAVQFATNLGSALGGALHDSTYKGIFVRDSSTPGGDTAYRLPNADSLHQVLQNSNDSMKSALADTMQTWFDELRNDFMLVNFDSAVIAPLGAKVPNTNTCPADCFKIDMSSLGGVFSGVREMNWGICEARIGPLDVLQFIRLILRIVTALTCIYIGLWIISGRKS